MSAQEIKSPLVDESGLPLVDGPVVPTHKWVDCAQYPYVQISPYGFCRVVNDLFKRRTGRSCSGLLELFNWRLDEKQDMVCFFHALARRQVGKYRGIGIKAANFIHGLINDDSSVIAVDSPFLLKDLSVCVETEEHVKTTFDRWLLAVDTRVQLGHDIVDREWPFQSMTYNHRLRVVQEMEKTTVRYMTDDIMTGRLMTLGGDDQVGD